MFLNHLYGGTDEPAIKIIDVFICKLRKKSTTATGGDNYIKTIWRRGFMCYAIRRPMARCTLRPLLQSWRARRVNPPAIKAQRRENRFTEVNMFRTALLTAVGLAAAAIPASAQGSWYYCEPARAYYPNISTCPIPWREVAANAAASYQAPQSPADKTPTSLAPSAQRTQSWRSTSCSSYAALPTTRSLRKA